MQIEATLWRRAALRLAGGGGYGSVVGRSKWVALLLPYCLTHHSQRTTVAQAANVALLPYSPRTRYETYYGGAQADVALLHYSPLTTYYCGAQADVALAQVGGRDAREECFARSTLERSALL